MAEEDKFIPVEKVTRTSAVFRADIPALGVYGVSQLGERFYFITATGTVGVTTDKTPEKPYFQGTGEQFPPDFWFHRLQIRNPNPYPISIIVWAGFGEYLDSRISVLEAPTKIYGVVLPGSAIPASSEVYLPGTPTNQQIQRKGFVISNMDLANSLFIMQANLAGVGTVTTNVVFPRTSITLPITGPFVVRNDTAGAIVTYIGEIWYVLSQS